MKRIISMITIVALLFAFVSVPASADNDVTYDMEQAIEIAKEKLELNTDGYEFSSNYYENSYNNTIKKVWSLNWYKADGTDGSFNVSVDAITGDILNYSCWTYNQTVKKLPKYTREEAQKAAEEFLNKVCPEKYQESSLVESPYDKLYFISNDSYSFNYIRQVGGIDFDSNSFSVAVDKNTLQVRYFYLNWDSIEEFPDASAAITENDAKDIFAEKQGLELTYQLVYPESYDKPVAVLAYALKGNTPIDAVTGELLENAYYYPTVFSNGMAMYRDEAMKMEKATMTVQEQKEIDDASKYISKEEAIEAVKVYLPEIDNYTLSNANLNSGYGTENASWYLSWNRNEKESGKYFYVSAAVDAVTSEVKSFYKDSSDLYNQEGDPKYTQEQAKDIASEFLEKIQPDKYALTEYQRCDSGVAPVYGLNFVRKENDIKCPFNSLYVNVSAYTGEVIGYSYCWTDVELPSSEGIIDIDKAYEVLYEKGNMALKYIKLYDYTSGVEKFEVKLAYVLDSMNGMIDANSGTVIGYDGKPVKDNYGLTEFTDIKGHAAESDIQTLIDIGMIQTEATEFHPDEYMLQKDFIKLLIKATEPYYYYPVYEQSGTEDEYDYYYRSAIQKKIISEREKNPDGYINRQEASKMFVRALGYGYIAEKPNLFVLPFDDANRVLGSYRGYIVIAEELGLFETVDNKFNPKKLLTNGDGATALVNFLKIDMTLE